MHYKFKILKEVNLWRVRVLVVLLALQAVLRLLLADVVDVERHVLQIVLQFVLEIARALAMVGVLVVVPIYALAAIPVALLVLELVPEVVWMHVTYRVLTLALIAIIHVLEPVLVVARIHAQDVEALALTIVRDALAHAQEPVQDVTDVVTNVLLHVNNLAPDVLGAVPAVHRAVQVASLLVVTLVPELAVMGVLIHAEHAVLLVQQAVLQIAEQLARVPVMEA